ncbi:MAG: TonB-dependent receptor [Sphingomonas sp.]
MRAPLSKVGYIVALGVLTTSAAQAQSGSPELQPSADEAVQADIVVTADRRKARVQDVPIAISAIGGEALRAGGNNGLSDIAQRVPSLTFAQSFGIAQIFIRGVGNNFFSPGGDPGVATYADGVYLSDQEATAVAFLDLDRVEVLRGPQGALYGRNATGGAVNLVSAAPSATTQGQVGARVGDFGRFEADGYVTGSLGGGVNARLSGQFRRLRGYARNELGATAEAPAWLDAERSFAGRVQLQAPIGAGSLRLIANGYTQDDAGPALKILSDPTPQPAEILFGVRPSADSRNLKSQVARNRRDVWSITATLAQPLSDSVTATLIADYRRSDRVITYDQDGTEREVSRTTLDTRSRQWSVEAYLQGRSDHFDWLAGATYLDFRQTRVTTVPGLLPAAFLDPRLPLTLPFPFAFDGGGTIRTKAWAAYGDVTARVSDIVRLRIGARYSNDTKRADEFLTFLAPTVRGVTEKSWGQWSGKAGIDVTPKQGMLFYASVARGFKSGALNVGAFTPPVNPETNLSWEIGAKLESGDRRAQLNIAAFASSYKDLQIVQIGPISQILANAADSKIKGVELEATVRPTAGLSLGATLSYTDAKFGPFFSTDQRRGFQRFDLTGNRLPLTSEWQGSMNACYDWTLGAGSTLGLSAALQFRSEYFFTEFNTTDARQRGFARVDLAASWTSSDKRVRVSAFARNLSNETVLSGLAVVSPLLGSVRVASLEPPRRFGVGIDFNF